MKRLMIWIAAVLIAVVVAVALAFRFSPWPSVAIISYMFAEGDQASEAALEKHVPAGIVSRRDVAYGGGPDEKLDVYYPEGTNGPLPAIVWVHGGAWIAGSKDGIANYLKVLAGHGYATLAVEYSRGYGATYPKPVEQVNAALGFIARNATDLKIDPSALVLAGDSAGAQITSQIALITTSPAYANDVGISPALKPDQLTALLLLSGAFDLDSLNFSGDYGWFLRTVLWAYSGVKNFRDDDKFGLISVTGHLTKAYPPTFISSGNGDPLAPQAAALAQKLSELGVPSDALFFPADRTPPLPHEYQFNLNTPAGQEALKRTLEFLDSVREKASTVPQ